MPQTLLEAVLKTRIGILAAAFILAVCVCAESYGQGSFRISPRNGERAVSEESLRTAVEFLSSDFCTGRATGTPGGAMASFYIAREFALAGLKPFGGSYFRGFRQRGVTGRNVLGVFSPGGASCRYIVVGAHYDHLGTLGEVMYPGADANASGVAALTSLARMTGYMRNLGKTFGKGVIFIAFDGKERNMAGSASVVSMLKNGSLTDPESGQRVTLDKIDMMVNIDQIGSTLAPLRPGRTDYLIMLSDGTSGRNSLIQGLNHEEGVHLDLGFDYYGSRDFTNLFYRRISDQKNFIDSGIPSVMFTSGITMRTNKKDDVADSLDYAVLRRRVILMYHYIFRLL